MSDRRTRILQLLLVACLAGLGLWAWQQLPPGAAVPVHFNAAGEVDGWAAPLPGLFQQQQEGVRLAGTRLAGEKFHLAATASDIIVQIIIPPEMPDTLLLSQRD